MAFSMDNELIRALSDAFLCLEDRGECFKLLEDLFTVREMCDMAQRLEVARMLSRHATYTEIAEKTGVSSATIGRVNRALTYGAGGYRLVLDRLENKNVTEDKNDRSE